MWGFVYGEGSEYVYAECTEKEVEGMSVTIVGSQLGDEGKGRIVDIFCDEADIVVRYQGGDNAGHTVVIEGEKYQLSLVPSGAISGKVGVLGNGCVINPKTLFDEIDGLRERGIDPEIYISQRAHVIFPFHKVADNLEEVAKKKKKMDAGTTGRGIGPTYEDKSARRGIRGGDLLDKNLFWEKLEYLTQKRSKMASDVIGSVIDESFDLETIYREYCAYAERIEKENMAIVSGDFITEQIKVGAKVIFEGAQGTSLDIDHGIYPHVTSSNSSSGYAATGSGVSPQIIGKGEIIGIVKAYLSRVGTGPLPTELEGDFADDLRERGGEYGTVTGRPRRVGWLDMPMLRHAARVNGFTGIVINHIDVLAGMGDIKVAESYEFRGESIRVLPPTTELWGECRAEYRNFSGWPECDWSKIAESGYDSLPEQAQRYINYVASEVDADVIAIGVGPSRSETILKRKPFNW